MYYCSHFPQKLAPPFFNCLPLVHPPTPTPPQSPFSLAPCVHVSQLSSCNTTLVSENGERDEEPYPARSLIIPSARVIWLLCRYHVSVQIFLITPPLPHQAQTSAILFRVLPTPLQNARSLPSGFCLHWSWWETGTHVSDLSPGQGQVGEEAQDMDFESCASSCAWCCSEASCTF